MMIDWFQALKPGVWVSIIHHLNRSKIHHHFFDLIYAIDSCLIHLRCYRLFCLLLILHVDICIDFRRKHYIFSPILDKQLLYIFLFPYACSLKEGHVRLWLRILKTYFPLIWGHQILLFCEFFPSAELEEVVQLCCMFIYCLFFHYIFI